MDAYGREVMFGMKRIQQNQSQRICRCVAGFLLTFAAVLPTLSASAESDLDAYMRGKIFRMWVNDDADKSDSETNPVDIPKQSNADCNDDHVNGRRDLVDFFPLWINISPFAPWLSGGQVGVRLSHADSAINIVWTKLGNLEAGKFHREDIVECGPNLDQNAYEATVTPVTAECIEVPQRIIDMILADPSKGIVMMEGVRSSTAPLTIAMHLKNGGDTLFSFRLPITISHVEDMYRWANIRAAAQGAVERPTDLSVPSGLPDSETNGKHFLFVHGYSVSEEKARGWASEMFKRMWQAGANCAFTAVTWYGDDSRHWWYLDNTPNYYVNVEHAFESAAALANVAVQLSGEKIIAAHSLGNLCVPILQSLHLVHDNHIGLQRIQLLQVLSDAVVGCYLVWGRGGQQLATLLGSAVDQQHLIAREAFYFTLPLEFQCGRTQHQHLFCKAFAAQQLSCGYGLNGLAQTHFIGYYSTPGFGCKAHTFLLVVIKPRLQQTV